MNMDDDIAVPSFPRPCGLGCTWWTVPGNRQQISLAYPILFDISSLVQFQALSCFPTGLNFFMTSRPCNDLLIAQPSRIHLIIATPFPVLKLPIGSCLFMRIDMRLDRSRACVYFP